MRVVPVLDVQGGVVVRGIAGRRREYRPLVSRLTPSTKPVDVAEAFRLHFGLDLLYLADLDAIAGSAPSLQLFRDLAALRFSMWVDAGVQDLDSAVPLADAGVAGIVVGLETVRGPAALDRILARFGADRVIFSLDMKEGIPLAGATAWQAPDAEIIAAQAIARGIQRLIVLDLARVGMNDGTGTDDLCRKLATDHPHVEIVAGGGVRNENDLQRMEQMGLKTVLVASALHDGRLRLEPGERGA